ncbi:MAG: LuxR C-terminal-related transcriptional regulator, partial [Verrucomicrobiota bacterium]
LPGKEITNFYICNCSIKEYYDTEHYGKLTPTYYDRSHEAKKEDHVGMDSRASMAGNGRFRVHRIRDREYLNFRKFEKTPHYQRYYRDGGIADRIMIGLPVTPNHESYFLIDRFQAPAGRALFTLSEATRAGAAVRGVPALHRRLFLGNGLLMADKLLSPMERQLLQALLTGQTEAEIAVSLRRSRTTLHKSVLALYVRFGVKSRAALVGLWSGG